MKKIFHKYTADRTIHEYLFVYDKEQEDEFMKRYRALSPTARILSSIVTSKVVEDESKRCSLITSGRPDLEVLFNDFELKSKKTRKVR